MTCPPAWRRGADSPSRPAELPFGAVGVASESESSGPLEGMPSRSTPSRSAPRIGSLLLVPALFSAKHWVRHLAGAEVGSVPGTAWSLH